MLLTKIISGGQTGADRGALDAAIALGIEHGGWCPAGRRAEDGIVPTQYQLTELPVGGERERTRKNVEDSDGTPLIARPSHAVFLGDTTDRAASRRTFLAQTAAYRSAYPSRGHARLREPSSRRITAEAARILHGVVDAYEARHR